MNSIMSEDAAKYITESDFQAAVIELAEAQGWKVVHFHDSRRWVPDKRHVGGGKWVGDAQAKGWVDLVLLRGGDALFIELKTEKGRVGPEQSEMGGALLDAKLRYGLWRPSMWGYIEGVLSLRTTCASGQRRY